MGVLFTDMHVFSVTEEKGRGQSEMEIDDLLW